MWVLSRKFLRARGLRNSALLVVGGASAVVVALYVALQSLTPTVDQVIERDLGRFTHSTGLLPASISPGDAAVKRRLSAAMESAEVQHFSVGLVSVDMQVVAKGSPSVRFYEDSWQANPLPKRYELKAGRWPSEPFEVAVTVNDALSTKVGRSLPVLSNLARFTVVGVVDDRYARVAQILAGEGTWAGLNPVIADDFPVVQAQPIVRWRAADGEDPSRHIAEAIATPATEVSLGELERTVRRGVVTRSDAAQRQGQSGIASVPAGYTIPSLLLPPLALFVVVGMHFAWLRDREAKLRSMGLPRGRVVAALMWTLTMWCTVAAVMGGWVGFAIGWLGSRLVQTLADQTVAPIVSPVTPLFRTAGLTLLALAGTGVWLYAVGDGEDKSTGATEADRAAQKLRPHQVVRDVRHVFAVITGCLTVLLAARLSSTTESMLMAGAFTLMILLLTPEIVTRALRHLPQSGPVARLSHRQMLGDYNRVVTTIASMALLLGGSLGFLTLLDTMIRTAGEQDFPDVLPGQLLVADRGTIGLPPSDSVLTLVKREPALRDNKPVRLRFLLADVYEGRAVRLGKLDGNILAVDSTEELSRMIGAQLTTRQRSVLRAGGIATWPPTAGPALPVRPGVGPRDLVVVENDRVLRNLGPKPVVEVDVPMSGWRSGLSGVMLTAEAERLDLPLISGAVLYTSVPDAEVEEVRRAVIAGGQDPRVLRSYSPPTPPVPPLALYLVSAGLVVATLTLTLAVSRAQLRSLQPYVGLMRTLGMPKTWCRGVMLHQHGFIVAIGSLIAGVTAIMPVLITVAVMPNFVLAVPWAQLLTLTAAVFLSNLAAISIGSAAIGSPRFVSR